MNQSSKNRFILFLLNYPFDHYTHLKKTFHVSYWEEKEYRTERRENIHVDILIAKNALSSRKVT